MGVVVDAKLVGHGQQQRVGLGNRLVLRQITDQRLRLAGIATAKHGALFRLDVAELVFLRPAAAEIGAVHVVDQREDRPADRHTRLARVTGLLPGGTISPNLLGLLDMKGLAALVELERRALQIHAKLGRPYGRGVGRGAPPDAVTQALGMWLQPQRTRGIWEHRPWIGLGKTLALERLEKHL